MKYLDGIIKDVEYSFYVDDIKAKKISQELSKHMKNKLYYNPTPLAVNEGIKIDGDYSTKNLRQSFFNDCVFDSVNYCNAGLSGSLFVKTQFNESNLLNTNFQSCDFRECRFEGIQEGLKYTRFSKSIFTDTIFKNTTFNGVSMNDTIFTNCVFLNCNWIPISIENALFSNTLLQNVKFKSMNFEFATFDNIKLDNIKLPFPTIPYIFNGLKYLSTTTDNVRITSAAKKEGLSINEYMENLDRLCEFYKYTHNYFPLANIFICKDMYKEAYYSILMGINLSIDLRRFRMLKNYCKELKYIKNITMHERQNLYRYILEKISKKNFKDYEQNNLNNYLPEIRQLLLENLEEEKIEISLLTNISANDARKLSILIDIISNLLEGKCTYSIELRHNSPWDIFISIFTKTDNISLIINSIMLIFSAIQTKIAMYQTSKNNKLTISQTKSYKDKLNKENIHIEKLTINNKGDIKVYNITIQK